MPARAALQGLDKLRERVSDPRMGRTAPVNLALGKIVTYSNGHQQNNSNRVRSSDGDGATMGCRIDGPT